MKRFFYKLFIHGSIITALIAVLTLMAYWQQTGLQTPKLECLPKHFVSNSVCFNTKLDHAKATGRLAQANILILGSSIALQNVSADLLTNQLRRQVYNLSSWGFKPYQSFELLKHLHGKLHIRHLLIPFNHTDFGTDKKTIDYKGAYTYLFANNMLSRVNNFLTYFTLPALVDDWADRTNYGELSNINKSLRFEPTGSIQIDPNQFRLIGGSLPTYQDTTGFAAFKVGVDSIRRYCDQNNIELTLIYLPWRSDVITATQQIQIQSVSQDLSRIYGRSFLNLTQVRLAETNFIDAGHLFKQGAIQLTQALADSLLQHHRPKVERDPVLAIQR